MKHYYQPNNFACVQTATAMLLSHYDIERTPEQVLAEVPVRSWPGQTEPAGTLNQDVGIYLLGLGFEVEIISQDIWITDLSWQDRDTAFIKSRLQAAAGHIVAPMLGRRGSELYVQGYLDFIEAGGRLSVTPVVTTARLRELLSDGPLMLTVAYDTLHGVGKHVNGDTRVSHDDDIKGKATNHNLVVTRFEDDRFQVYDPWLEPGIFMVGADQLIAAIATAQQECDNNIIVTRPQR